MRKIIYWVHQSVDGFIEGPNGEFDWPVMREELSAYSLELSERAGAFVYGRKVWEMMSYWWPRPESMADAHGRAFAPIWRRTPKIVLSRTLESADHGARVIGADLVGQVAALKAEPGGDLLLTGGSAAAAALTDHGLIDEYQVIVHPVVLGGGRPVFPPKDRLALRLVGSRGFDGASVLLRYERAG
ncbi:dihydrofolate reductase family protein [Micromonospora sp. 4G57]|uniref:Dihydrofolate reductase family protein n=1 Tax=Micromonospora sicca TaxID=2202420 RepID=A0ABU5JGY0_9ACTN|nr:MULTISPECIES: dihydrofolate reductase family protein [unclassified Micromonospora]MDZ5444042.1 dihydrofolate reductase family protein [Micromonospora sp. 4G57]MDZ5491831.1 dihydrofolate reductase family protein [Micromonospora sp. 4G53]